MKAMTVFFGSDHPSFCRYPQDGFICLGLLACPMHQYRSTGDGACSRGARSCNEDASPRYLFQRLTQGLGYR